MVRDPCKDYVNSERGEREKLERGRRDINGRFGVFVNDEIPILPPLSETSTPKDKTSSCRGWGKEGVRGARPENQ